MNLINENSSIAAAIREIIESHAERPAISVGPTTLSYREMHAAAQQIRSPLEHLDANATIGVYADRSVASYAAILAATLTIRSFVPVNPNVPCARNADIVNRSGIDVLLVSKSGKDNAYAILEHARRDIVRETVVDDHLLAIEIIPSSNDLAATTRYPKPFYILFTSGSTGSPKGVPISETNLVSYLRNAHKIVQPTPNDRFSQTFEQTFDLAMHDIFLAWTSGGRLCVAESSDFKNPADYIRREKISCWFSVPSLAYQMQQQGALETDAFPSVRFSLFCGEGLPTDLCRAWQRAAPKSAVQNIYGPTEATIACTGYPVADSNPIDTDLVPIGRPFENTRAIVFDHDNGCECSDGDAGELCLAGAQVALGYLDDPEKTRAAFVNLPGLEGTFYRTGDRVARVNGELHFIGRVDNQIKLRGYRIELGDVEAALRRVTDGRNVVALAWPPKSGQPSSIVAAIEGDDIDTGPTLRQTAKLLPSYMVPSSLVPFSVFPKNASGKTDRTQISEAIATYFRDSRAANADQTELEQQLLKTIETINPALDRQRVIASDSLFAAGMDSLGFTILMTAFEQQFGVKLDQTTVEALSQVSFQRMVKFLSADPKDRNIRALETQKESPRANRVLHFIQQFPNWLKQCDRPVALAIGSSGTLRAFSPNTFERTLADQGCHVQAANVGLPAIDVHSITMVCRYVNKCCLEQGITLEMCLYELDPMHLGFLRPKNDIRLEASHFQGARQAEPVGTLDPEFEWDANRNGLPYYDHAAWRKKTTAAWSRKRDIEIAETFQGKNAFREEVINDWIRGAMDLQEVSKQVMGFIHPLNVTDISSQTPNNNDNYFTKMMQIINEETSIEFIYGPDFSLKDEDFLNFNHVNPWQGMEKISVQLAERFFSKKSSPESAINAVT